VLVQLNDVSKAYGSKIILRGVSLQINPFEKIGLIGANGAGKTTLLRIIAQAIEIDSGSINRRSNLRMGMLEQIPDFRESRTVVEEGLQSSEHLQGMEREMTQLEHAISDGADKETLERYSQLQHEFKLKGGYSYRARTEAALLGVGFTKDVLNKPSKALSGGEKNRLALAKLLLSRTDLLLLDEPTNHLDLRSIEWLEKFLQDTDKSVVVVSHDRFFLDRVVSRVVEVVDSHVNDYNGNYSAYLRERTERLARQQKEWELQSEWIGKQEEYIRRNIAGQKTKQAQSRRKLLARVKPLERPNTGSGRVKFRFMPLERGSRHVLTTRLLTVGYGNVALVRSLQFQVQRGQRWAILGPNGSGKTTLLRTLIGALPPLDGEMDWSEALDVGYYDQQLQDLDSDSIVLDELREVDATATDGELRSYLAMFLFSGEDVFKRVNQLSGGEKSRLMLAKIIHERPQLLALDEPTNHLDIASREALELALAEYPGTIIFITHDRYLVQKIASHLIYIENGSTYIFDRLSAFEEWLTTARDAVRDGGTQRPGRDRPARSSVSGLSKNRRDRLMREASALEAQIAAVEKELAELESTFQAPEPSTDWESKHRRYDELKNTREKFYEEWSRRVEALEEPSELR
jgi:ATP-binding cassette subfamily F protein 3